MRFSNAGFERGEVGFQVIYLRELSRTLRVWPRKHVTIVRSKLLNTCLGVYLRQRMSMYLFVVELKTALLPSANSFCFKPSLFLDKEYFSLHSLACENSHFLSFFHRSGLFALRKVRVKRPSGEEREEKAVFCRL